MEDRSPYARRMERSQFGGLDKEIFRWIPVGTSVADPGYLSRIQIPDPDPQHCVYRVLVRVNNTLEKKTYSQMKHVLLANISSFTVVMIQV